MSSKNPKEIIKKALDGQQSAFTELLNLYWNDINNFLSKKCKYDYEAEDLTIKTFARAFDKLDLYDPKYSFKTWLITIANNLYVDFLRSQQKTIETLNVSKDKVQRIVDDSESSEDRLIREQQLDTLLTHLKTLKPHYRKVIQLRYFQEYSIRDIALEIGESTTNVKVKLLRARKLLSEKINQK